MNIVIPMAGLGSRFSSCGFTLPKPLIPVGEKPMYRQAVDCLPLELTDNLVFILREDEHSQRLQKDIQSHYAFIRHLSIVMLPHETRGQAETVAFSQAYVDPKAPILVHNCDTAIAKDLKWAALLEEDIDAALVLFSSNEPRWSYAKLDVNNQFVIDVQEKKVISSHASSGTYFFNNTPELFHNIEKTIQENNRQQGEFYLSTIYQYMIAKQQRIKPIWSKQLLCFGTPSDLVTSLNHLLLEGFH